MSAVRDIEFTQIAAEWDSITLGEEEPQALLAMRNGLTAKQVQDGGEFKVSRIETIGGGWIDESRVRFTSGLKEKDVEKYLLRKGDILFSHINSDRHLGKTGFAERDYDDLLHGMNLLLIRANPDVFDPDFLNRVFQYYRDKGVFIAICSRAVNQSSINQAKMKALELPLPPLPEQKKIAHILSTVQRAIEAQERIIQTTTELKKALMHKLFTEGLRNEPQKQTEIGPVPESWGVEPLGELLTVAQYGMSVKGNPEGNYPILRMTNQINGQIVANKLQFVEINERDFEKFKVERGDILFNRTNSLELVGRTAIHDITGNFVFASYLIRVRTEEKRLNPFFLNLDFNRDETQARLKSIATRAVSQSNISATRLKGFPVPVPSLNDQAEMVAQAASFDRKLAVHHRKASELQALFRTLLHELMTAKTRVHYLEIPPKGSAA